VEEQAKQSFTQVLHEQVLNKLNMADTVYEFNETLDQNPNLARPALYSNGKYYERENYGQFIEIGPAGAIFSNVKDMAKYAITMLNYGNYPATQTRILSEEMAKNMFARHFSNRKELSGIGLIWMEDQIADVPFVNHGGALPPYFAQLSLFHTDGVAFFAAMVGSSNVALSILQNKFIVSTMRNESRYCTEPNETYDVKTGICQESVEQASIVPASANHTSQWKLYEGCYRNFRYEHTSWLKIASIFTPPICVYADGNVMRLISPSAVLVEVAPNVFKIGVQDNSGKNITFVKSKYSRATFVSVNEGSQADFLVIDQFPLENTKQSLVFILLLQLSIAFLVITQVCCCCGCIASWSFFDVRNYIQIYRNRSVKKETDAISNQFSNYEEDDDLEHQTFGTGVITKKRFYHVKTKTRSKILLGAAIALTVLTILAILIVSILNLIHIIGVVSKLISVSQNALVHQSGSGFTFIGLMPVFATILLVLLAILSFATAVVRILKREAIGLCFTILLVLSIVPVFAVNILYFVSVGYFNNYGPSLLS
jgi:hypothetical protein